MATKALKPPLAPKRPSKRLKLDNRKLKNLANEPFIKDKGVPGGWNSVLPKESPDLARPDSNRSWPKANRRRVRPPTSKSLASDGNSSS